MSTSGPYGSGPTDGPGGTPPPLTGPPPGWGPASGSAPGAGAAYGPAYGSAPGTGASYGPASGPAPGAATGTVPPPPRGPGVQPPFAAPPTDQDRKRLWIGLGIAAAVLLLCAAGGVFGIGALALGSASQIRAQAHSTVSGYLSDLKARNFGGAYTYWCASRRDQMSVDEFASQMQAEPPVTGFRLGSTELGGQVIQPATVDYAGTSQSVRFLLVEEGSTGTLKICQITG